MKKNLILIAGGVFAAALGILGFMQKKQQPAASGSAAPVPGFSPETVAMDEKKITV